MPEPSVGKNSLQGQDTLEETVPPPARTNLRRSLVMNTGASALTPVVGLVTAPVIAQSLGVGGRGEFSAALAPALIVGSVAAFGLSESLTFHVAKNPLASRRALWSAIGFVTVFSIPVIATMLLLAPSLSGGEPGLARTMQLATVLCFPVLYTSLVRGAAVGEQRWGLVTLEKVLSALLRLGLIVGLAATGHLTVLSAVLLSSLLPLATVLIYWGVLFPSGSDHSDREPLIGSMLKYAARTWVGSVAVMLLSRVNQLLLTPLSSVEQVGLFAIAITIADVPFIFTTAVRDVLFGINSATSNVEQLARVSRLTLLMTITGSAAIGLTLPLWLAPLFGSGFESALPVTILLLTSQALGVPGMMMGAAAASLGFPGIRSTAQIVALAANVVGLVLLAPQLGALGAGLASLVDCSAVLIFSSYRLRKERIASPSDFFAIRAEDVNFLLRQLNSLSRRALRRA